MKRFYLFQRLISLTIGKLCQQMVLLAVLSLLCVLLPSLLGQGVEQVLSDGVSFSGIVLAVTAPEGEAVPKQVERYVGSMTDVRQYCRIVAMEETAALQALTDGTVTAILALPENFVKSVQWGENPDVRLIVDGRRPTEALLTLWVGQGASDILFAAQTGIYAVLACYEAQPTASLSLDEVVLGINLKYMKWTANRQDVFESQVCLPTGTLPIALHYGLSLLGALLLSLAPLFCWNFQGGWLTYYRRIQLAGRSALTGFWSSILVCVAAMIPVMTAGLVAVGGLSLLPALGVGVLWAVLFAVWAAVCGLLTSSAASCGCLSFAMTLVFLVTSGGIVPPVLMPEWLHLLEWCSPVTWMRAAAAAAQGYTPAQPPVPLLLSASVVLCALSAVLYVRRVGKQGGET